MFAFAVDEQRIVVRIEIGVLAGRYQMFNRFVMDRRGAFALAADHLDAVLDHRRQLIFRGILSSLTLESVDDLCIDEHTQYVIHRSYRYTLRRTGFRQLLRSERLG